MAASASAANDLSLKVPAAELRHSWSLRWLALQAGASLVRTLGQAAQSGRIEAAVAAMPASVTRSRIRVPSREAGREIIVDVYEAVDRPAGPTTLHINAHGSGYLIPSLGADLLFCQRLALAASGVVYDVDYRKSPAAPFPAAMHDILDVVAYAETQSSIDASRITLSGFSAGASLCMSVALHLGPERVLGIAAFYGQTAFDQSHPPPRDPTESEAGVTLPPIFRRLSYGSYILPSVDRTMPILSTLYAPVDAWPRHFFLGVGDCDSLYESNRLLHAKLRDGGHAHVELMTVERVNHAFDKMAKPGSAAEQKRDEMYEQAIQMLKTARAH